MAHAAAQKTAKEANADNAGRFYDGYRWVDREDTLGGTATLGQRRVTIQNLPPEIDEPQLRAFLAAALGACGVAVPDDQPDLILSCWLSEERKCDRLGVLHVRPYKYAFVQLATVQSAETAIGLTGISCMGNTIKVESCSTDQTGLRTMAALAAGHVSQPGGDFDFAGLLVPGAAAALGMATGLRG
ncbi:hypothetical protein M885DRAFT_503344 [Pelagophyceae sp. CCMP2097]|nr:hypothetical protein M885DRAFT_503344 [Pelagophyceae sp. CCMP2097]